MTGLDALDELRRELAERGTTLVVAGRRTEFLTWLRRIGLDRAGDDQCVFPTLHQAVRAFREAQPPTAAAAANRSNVMRHSAHKNGKLTGKAYTREMRRLQAELCKLQDWVKHKGLRIVIVFEGRDGAGKGGTIRAITERVSPRVFRVVALPAPTEREKSQMYLQRYLAHFPAAGEVVIFDRSWYNRAGVEYVMGFCSKEEHRHFLKVCPLVEKFVTDHGVQLIKYWLEVSDKEQKRRFEARVKDPLRQWKLSPIDLPSRKRWFDYSRARDMMLDATDTRHAPWHIVRSDDKKRARLNCIRYLLSQIPYKKVPSRKGQASRAIDEARLRRPGHSSRPEIHSGEVLTPMHPRASSAPGPRKDSP